MFNKIFNKIKNFFITEWKDYKYHSLMMDPYFSKPSKFEQIFGFVVLFFLLISLAYRIKLLLLFSLVFATIGMSIQTYRVMKESANCWKGYVKPYILKGKSPFYIVTRSTGTLAALAIKYGKPVIKACAICITAGSAGVSIYDYAFGFNPLREAVYVYTKKQTGAQAWHHITHPTEYMNSEYPPHIKDLEDINAELINKNSEQEKQIKELLDKLKRK